MTILSTDKLLVNRNAQSYYVDQQDIADREEAGDLLLINRLGDSYRVNIEEVHDKVLDSDIVLANREGVSFRATGAELKAAIAPPGIESVLTSATQDGPLLTFVNTGLNEFTGDRWGPFNGDWGAQNSSYGVSNDNGSGGQKKVEWTFKRPIPLGRYFTFGNAIWDARGEVGFIQTSTGSAELGEQNMLAPINIDLNRYNIPAGGYLLKVAMYCSPTKNFRFYNFGTSSSENAFSTYSPQVPDTYPSAANTIKILPSDTQTVLTTADNLVIPNGSSISQSNGGASGVTAAYKNGYSGAQIPLESSTGTWSANGTNKVVYTTRKVQRLLDVAVAIDGYYPLFTLEEEANIVGNGTSHSHVVDGVTYYMPDGGTDTYHGNY